MSRGDHKPVTMPERKRMRALREQGMTYRQIAEIVGRTAPCAYVHCHDVVVEKPTSQQLQQRTRRLTRMERLYASCNRAIAEARA